MHHAIGHAAPPETARSRVFDTHIPDLQQRAIGRRQWHQFPAPWQRVQQLPGVFGLGGKEDVFDTALLDRLARAHHHDFVGITRHQGQIVADKQNRGALLAGQFQHQLDHIQLRQAIQGRGRLVGNQQRRAQQHHRGEHDALAHATGELVRVGCQTLFGVLDADALQHGDAALMDRRRIQRGMQLECLAHLPADGQRGVERDHRFLEHHADPRTPHFTHGLGITAIQRLPLEEDAPTAHLHRCWQQANGSSRGHSLAATRLAHQCDDFAGGHGEAEVIDGQRTVHADANL